MHYCPLWKVGTHYGWERIEPWPERKPAIGWYDEGTPEVADWHIKIALEHGIQGFIYCWYRADFSPEIHQTIGHAVHDGMLKAKYLDRFQFAIMWENGCAKGVQDRDDLMNNVLPYWLDNYFTHPSYVKIDNKPLLFVWRPERVAAELGGSAATRKVFDEMRAACRKRGLEGLWIVGCVETANEGLLKRLAEEGWDATSAYATWSQPQEGPAIDIEGVTTVSNRAHVLAQKDVWLGKKAVGALPDIVSVMQGWDPRPWHGAKTQSYWADPSPEDFRAACREAKRIIDATPGNGLDKRVVVFDNWDEFGEGHYIEPTVGFGFQYVDVIRDVFCTGTQPCQHMVPEDVGLEPPERWYRQQREILEIGVRKVRKVVDHLLAWWTFDGDNDLLAARFVRVPLRRRQAGREVDGRRPRPRAALRRRHDRLGGARAAVSVHGHHGFALAEDGRAEPGGSLDSQHRRGREHRLPARPGRRQARLADPAGAVEPPAGRPRPCAARQVDPRRRDPRRADDAAAGGRQAQGRAAASRRYPALGGEAGPRQLRSGRQPAQLRRRD